MRKVFEAAGLLLLFVCAGSLWLLLERCLPDGWPRSVSIVLLGGVFAGVFLWLLVSRLRELFAGLSPLARQLLLAVLDLALLIGAFGVMYQRLGILDNTTPGPHHPRPDDLPRLCRGDLHHRGVRGFLPDRAGARAGRFCRKFRF